MSKVEIDGVTYLLIREDEYLEGTSYLKTNANRAINALTCMELEVAKTLFEKLKTTTDVIMSKIAEESGATQSLATLMLKKLESSNIVEIGNMGSKGLRIKILNNVFEEMLSKI